MSSRGLGGDVPGENARWVCFAVFFAAGLVASWWVWSSLRAPSGRLTLATFLLGACFVLAAALMPRRVPKLAKWAFRACSGMLLLSSLVAASPVPDASSVGSFLLMLFYFWALLVGYAFIWLAAVFLGGGLLLTAAVDAWRLRRAAKRRPRVEFTLVRR